MTDIFNRPDGKNRRREFRTNMPPAEAILWSRLKGRQLLGVKFRRQYSVGSYFVDFDSVEVRLAIELDGDSHFTPAAKIEDAERQRYIESLRIRFLRFINPDVYDNLDGVLEVIAREIEFIRRSGESSDRGAQ